MRWVGQDGLLLLWDDRQKRCSGTLKLPAAGASLLWSVTTPTQLYVGAALFAMLDGKSQ